MNLDWSRACGPVIAQGVLRTHPEDFQVEEELGFIPAGEGEHVFLFIQKRGLNTQDVARELSRLAGVPERDIGYSGLKDRHAQTRQWFSIGMAGRTPPQWSALHRDSLQVLEQTRHLRKLRRGVHRCNRFRLTLRQVTGDRDQLHQRLEQVVAQGVPNYFGEQRFGNQGRNLTAALSWMQGRTAKPKREQKSFYLSALRSWLFNLLLAQRVEQGNWQVPESGDVCMLRGSNSLFVSEQADAQLLERARSGDISPGLPLWGRGRPEVSQQRWEVFEKLLAEQQNERDFLLKQGLELGWRTSRLLADDFCWEFCDDGALLLQFSLQPGSFATAVLREIVAYSDATRG